MSDDIKPDHALRRYALHPENRHMFPVEGGAWVRYEEAAAAIEALRAERDAALARLHRISRTSELSAAVMRDKTRTGGWEGAERVARAFDRIAALAAQEADRG